MNGMPFSPMMVAIGRTDHAIVTAYEHTDGPQYTPPRSSMTFLRLRHRNDETTSPTLNLEQRGGRRPGWAPMLSKQETQIVGGMVGGGWSANRRRLEVEVRRLATVDGWLSCLIAFELTLVWGVVVSL